jgi:hypothetical protein
MEQSMASFVCFVEVYKLHQSPFFWKITTLSRNSFYGKKIKSTAKVHMCVFLLFRLKCDKCHIWIKGFSSSKMEVLLRNESEWCGLEIAKERVAKRMSSPRKPKLYGANDMSFSPAVLLKNIRVHVMIPVIRG